MNNADDDFELKKEHLAKTIIGEIAMAEEPSKTIKKWRSLFRTSQKELARTLGVTSSVVSDYESGRRKSPGIIFLKRYVQALMKIDVKNGSEVLKEFLNSDDDSSISAAILDIREFDNGIRTDEFCRKVGARLITAISEKNAQIYGYTLIDSVKAITEMSFSELKKLYGITTQRALVFTNITSGKGPMIAIKVANLKPALIILHNLPEREVSSVAKNIAVVEEIPLSVCENTTVEEFEERVRGI